MSYKEWWNVLAGTFMLCFGLHVIVTRKVAVGKDEEPYLYVYGWRAVCVGIVALAFAALEFASVAGLIAPHDWGGS